MARKVQYLLDAIQPYQLVFCICGIASFPVFKNDLKYHRFSSVLFHIYKAFLIVGTLFVTVERCKFVVSYSQPNSDYFLNGLLFLEFTTMTMIQFTMYLIVFLKYKCLRRVLLEIMIIEQDLIDISSKMHKLCARFAFKRKLFCVSGLMLLTVLMTPLMSLYMLTLHLLPFSQWLFSTFSEITIRCKTIEFCVLLQLINQLLKEVSTLVRESQRNLNSANDGLANERSLLQKRLVIIQNLHSRLWVAINALTDLFSITILCHFVFNGLTITNMVYWLYAKYNETSVIVTLSMVFTLTILLLDIFLPCYLCDACVQTNEQIIRLLHAIKPSKTDICMKMSLREYTLQISHQKLIFSCGGYFDINLQCFGRIVLTVTTYVVVLIQFKLQAEKE